MAVGWEDAAAVRATGAAFADMSTFLLGFFACVATRSALRACSKFQTYSDVDSWHFVLTLGIEWRLLQGRLSFGWPYVRLRLTPARRFADQLERYFTFWVDTRSLHLCLLCKTHFIVHALALMAGF